MKTLLLLCSIGLGACGGGSSSPPDPGPGPIVGPGLLTGVIAITSEIEPNDDLTSANPLALPNPDPTVDFVGVVVNGSVNDVADTADNFSFTSTRTSVFVFKLCDDICATFNRDGTTEIASAYFEILDQTGTLLLSTQGDSVNGNYAERNIDAGVIYYARVRAEDTMSDAYGYSMIIVERNP